MKPVSLLIIIISLAVSLQAQEWNSFSQDSLVILYNCPVPGIQDYAGNIAESVSGTESFFGKPFRRAFFVRIHGSRDSFDKQLAEDWHEPGFRSECWMVASGSAPGMDLICPATWDTVACEHKQADTAATRKLIHHELIHVYHGQWNKSPDFSATKGLDWFVEGLATYVSGQLDSSRRLQVSELIRLSRVPASLDLFWTGHARYALSGALVEFIDKSYGREMIQDLLPLTIKSEVLNKLNITEDHLIRDFINSWPVPKAPELQFTP
jgi:hypothetical protein